MKLHAAAAVAALGLTLSGCATIVQGSTQSVSVTTTPEQGAQCTLKNSEGTWFITSPGSVTVHKTKHDLTVDCVKPGLPDGHAVAVAKFGGTTAGNILAGGVIGLTIDAASGANFYYDSPITVALGPTPAASATATPATAPATAAAPATAPQPAAPPQAPNGKPASPPAAPLQVKDNKVTVAPGTSIKPVAVATREQAFISRYFKTCFETKQSYDLIAAQAAEEHWVEIAASKFNMMVIGNYTKATVWATSDAPDAIMILAAKAGNPNDMGQCHIAAFDLNHDEVFKLLVADGRVAVDPSKSSNSGTTASFKSTAGDINEDLEYRDANDAEKAAGHTTRFDIGGYR